MPDGVLGMSIEPCMLDVLSEACICPVQREAVNNYILSVIPRLDLPRLAMV